MVFIHPFDDIKALRDKLHFLEMINQVDLILIICLCQSVRGLLSGAQYF